MSDPTLELAMELIRRASITPDDGGCEALIAERLAPLGFTIEPLRFGEVSNLWARRGTERPLVVFAGHVDVVPTGPRARWRSDPFTPSVRDGYLYGRGAADMKASLAAFVTALEDFVAAHPQHRGSLAALVTSDEEGPGIDGTARVVDWLRARGEHIDYCIVGEPSSEETLGDVVKNGRRGSLNARLTVHGIQGHVAYPERADNPIHRSLPALAELAAMTWDAGDEHFPPTRLQISNIHAGTGADNVVPGELEVRFNFRFSPALDEASLSARTEEVLHRHGLHFSLEWSLSGRPFLTPAGALVDAVRAAVHAELGCIPRLSTSGGTSDGRFIAPTGAQVIELGPVNSTIHQIDERVGIDEPRRLARLYRRTLERLLA